MNADRPRRAVLALPNGFTLGNLFLGIFAIVEASRGEYDHATLYIVLGAILDGLDGRIARATRSSTRFGEELDSLVDAISFGLAPALLMYFSVLRHEGWDWVFVFLFSACACIRLARFNVEQAGRAKRHFIGLPSPAAGGTLAMYYWFSQTPLYTETWLAGLAWQVVMKYLLAVLAFLMISNVPYPTWPTFSLKSVRGVLGLTGFLAVIAGLIVLRKEFFFPVAVAYVLFAPLRAGIQGLLARGDENGEADDPASEPDQDEGESPASRQTRRLHGRPGRPSLPQDQDLA